MSSTGGSTGALRLRIYRQALKGEPFDAVGLSRLLDINYGRITPILQQMRDAGWARAAGSGSKGRLILELTEAGKVGIRSVLPSAQSHGADPRVNMWRSARQLTRFSPYDIMAWSSVPGAEVNLATARQFCGFLLRGGYLRVVCNPKRGVREAIYQLVRDTGPKPPVPRRVRAIYDANEERFVYVAGVDQ